LKIIITVLLISSYCSGTYANEQTSLFGYITNKVIADGMAPTLLQGDFVASDPEHFKKSKIKRGDIVLIKSPKNDGSLWIKRIIGLSGETLEIKNGKIYINNKLLNESYVLNKNNKGWVETFNETNIIPSDYYYVLGDNRVNSMDSRHFGSINKNKIVARATSIYYSSKLTRIGSLNSATYP